MKFILPLVTLISLTLFASNEKDLTKEQKALKKIMQEEQKFAKEQKFYQGKEYDLKAQEIDPSVLDNIPVIEPENDFDMDDVYD